MQKIKESTAFFIARRITADKTGVTKLSRLMVHIATGSVAISILVMIVALAVTAGFQTEIRNKLAGLTGHIILGNYTTNLSAEITPVDINRVDIPTALQLPGVSDIRPVALKGGIIKTNDEVQGALLKGVDQRYAMHFFESYLVEGSTPVFSDTVLSNDALLPLRLARQLRLKAGDRFDMFFVQDPPRSRRFTVKGIYNAQLDDVVNALIICDIKHIRRLNGWNEGEASSVEVFIDNPDRLDEVSDAIDEQQAGTMTEEKGRLKVQTVKDLYPHLFDWLYLLDTNVWIILILMLCVAGFNMISGLLILVFERTSMIGLLKTLGMQNSGIQRIFLYRAAFITLRGLFWGNITGIFLCILQQRFHFIALDASNYYTDSVPVLLQPAPLILLNLCGFAGIILLLALPVFVISHITPDRTLKTE